MKRAKTRPDNFYWGYLVLRYNSPSFTYKHLVYTSWERAATPVSVPVSKGPARRRRAADRFLTGYGRAGGGCLVGCAGWGETGLSRR